MLTNEVVVDDKRAQVVEMLVKFSLCSHADRDMIKQFVYLQPDAMNMIPAQMQIPGLDLSANLQNTATEVLCLMNMVEIEELMDDEEYEGNKPAGSVVKIQNRKKNSV